MTVKLRFARHDGFIKQRIIYIPEISIITHNLVIYVFLCNKCDWYTFGILIGIWL